MTDITQADIAKLKEAAEKARDTFKAFQDDNSHNAMQERLDAAYSDVGAYSATILDLIAEREALREALKQIADTSLADPRNSECAAAEMQATARAALGDKP